MDRRAYLQTSRREDKKWQVTLVHPDGRRKTVHFGGKCNGKRCEDYTIHKDKDKMRAYLARHGELNEDWSRTGIETPGFWARWLLWSDPSRDQAAKAMRKRFGVRVVSGPPPPASGGRRNA